MEFRLFSKERFPRRILRDALQNNNVYSSSFLTAIKREDGRFGMLLRLYEKRHPRYELEHLRRLSVDNIVALDARKGHIINFDPSIGREIAIRTKIVSIIHRAREFSENRAFIIRRNNRIHDRVMREANLTGSIQREKRPLL